MSGRLQHEDIKARIALLEEKTQMMESNLRQRADDVVNSVSPTSLLKSAISGITGDSAIGNRVLHYALNVGLGLLGSRLMWGTKGRITEKILDAALQLGSSKAFRNNWPVWKRFVSSLLKK